VAELQRATRLDTALLGLDFLRNNNIPTKDIETALANIQQKTRQAEAFLSRKLSSDAVILTSHENQLREYDRAEKPSLPDIFDFDELVFPPSINLTVWQHLFNIRHAQYNLLKLVEGKYASLNNKRARGKLHVVAQERRALGQKLYPVAIKVAREVRNLEKNISTQLLISEIELLCHEIALDEMPHQFNGICAKIRAQIAEIKRGLVLLRKKPWLPTKVAATISTALMCLVLQQGISQEPASGPPPENDLSAQIDDSPENQAQKAQPARRSDADMIRALVRKSTGAKQAGGLSLADQVRQTAATPQEEIAHHLAVNSPEQAVAAFEKAITEDSISIREQYANFNSKIAPLLDDSATPEATKAKIRQLDERFHNIEVSPAGTGENEGIVDNNSAEVETTETRGADINSVGVNNADLQFGEVRNRENYTNGYFMGSVFDRMEHGNLTKSINAPADPAPVSLDPERHVEIAQNFNAGKGIQLLRTNDGRVDTGSISFEDFEGSAVTGLSFKTRVDRFGFVHLEEFSDPSFQGRAIYKIRPVLESRATNAAEIEAHYKQITPQEPLQLTQEMRTLFTSWRNLPSEQIASNLQGYLQEYAVYSTSAEVDALYTDTNHSRTNIFLREKVGACRHFNEAFVVIMREFYGLPARLVIGSLYNLNQRNSHRWAEVYYAGNWHRFDATGSPIETGSLEGINVQEEYAAMEATPANFSQLQEKIRLTVQNNFRPNNDEEYEDRSALFRIAKALGPEFTRSAISSTWREIHQRFSFSRPPANIFWDNILLNIEYYASNSSEPVPALLNRARNIIASRTTNSATRANYMITFRIFENVDEYYAQGYFTAFDYIIVRFAQAIIEDRPVSDLAGRPGIREVVAQNFIALLHDELYGEVASAERPGEGFLIYEQMEFFYEALSQSGSIDTLFSHIANDPDYIQPTHAPLAFSLLGYIAYRTQNQAYRERVRDIFTLYHRTPEQQISFIKEYNAPWLLYCAVSNEVTSGLLGLSGATEFTLSRLSPLLTRLDAPQARTILLPVLDRLTEILPRQVNESVANELVGFDDFNTLLRLHNIGLDNSNQFLTLARQIAPQVLEATQQEESIPFNWIDLSILPNLRYLDEDDTGDSIAFELLSRAEFSNLSNQESFLRAISERREAPADFQYTPQGMRNNFRRRAVLGASLDGLLLAQGTTPQEVAANNLFVPTREEVNSWLERYLELTPDLIHHLLLINFTAELQGIPRDTSGTIDYVFGHSNLEGASFLPDLLYPDLLSEEPLPPNTQALYLQTLDRALQGATLTEEDFRQIGNIVARNSNNPAAIKLLAPLARNPEIDFEMPSFARLTPNFLSAASGLPGNDRALIASFLLAEGAEANAPLSASVTVQDRLLQMVEDNLQAGSSEDRAMLSRNLSRFRNEAVREEFLLRQIELDRPGRNAAEISTLADMLERIDHLGLRMGEDS